MPEVLIDFDFVKIPDKPRRGKLITQEFMIGHDWVKSTFFEEDD